MKVLKRNDEIQDFNFGKIETSIARASDDVKEPITMSDIEIICRAVLKNLKHLGKETVTSNQIFETLLLELEKDRFYKLAKCYREGANR